MITVPEKQEKRKKKVGESCYKTMEETIFMIFPFHVPTLSATPQSCMVSFYLLL